MRKYLYLSLIIAPIAALILWGRSWTRPQTSLDSFAQCLRDQGFTMYGANWCPHCQSAKQAFGESFRFISYIECPSNPRACLEKNVEGYPTWIGPNGTRLVGWSGLADIAAASGCAPDEPTKASDTAGSVSESLRGEPKNDDGQNEVTVTAEFSEKDNKLVFLVSLDTHTQDLSSFVAQEYMYLELANGEKIFPEGVTQDGAGHHQQFTIIFRRIDGPIKLVVANLVDVPKREFVWTR